MATSFTTGQRGKGKTARHFFKTFAKFGLPENFARLKIATDMDYHEYHLLVLKVLVLLHCRNPEVLIKYRRCRHKLCSGMSIQSAQRVCKKRAGLAT